MSVLAQHRHYDGKLYKFVVTGEQQANCPKWDPERETNPPLSAAKALAKANEFIAQIKTDDTSEWEFENLALVAFDGWMWQARYRLTKKHGVMTGAWPQMDCWILMDGTVIQPRITDPRPLD
jgi:hypothetical protein